jgi:Galactose oxidase, central domain
VGYKRFLVRIPGVVVALICACMAIAIGYGSAQEVPAAKSPTAKLKVTPKSLSFRINFGQGPATETLPFTITNRGTAPMTLSIGSVSAPFAVISGGDTTGLAPGASATVTVEFAPTASGKVRPAKLSIVSSAPHGSTSVKLRGKANGTPPTPTATATPTATPTPIATSGNVLIAGGVAAGAPLVAEVYNTQTNTSAPLPNLMTTPRVDHVATLLADGRVLLTGGMTNDGDYSTTLSSAEIFDPKTQEFTATGNMSVPRQDHTATLIEGCNCPADGKVLITGGDDPTNTALDTAELFDPASGTFTATGNMTTARESHTATLLPSGPLAGRVLVVGGYNAGHTSTQASAELYDPVAGTFTATGSMHDSRQDHVTVLLANGQVLVAEGFTGQEFPTPSGGFLTTAELFDPATQTFTYTGSLADGNEDEGGGVLIQGCNCSEDGMVFIVGGNPFPDAVLYDPVAGAFTAITYPGNANDQTVTMLANGKVLIAGGNESNITQIYDPAAGTFSLGLPNLYLPRSGHTATLLK